MDNLIIFLSNIGQNIISNKPSMIAIIAIGILLIISIFKKAIKLIFFLAICLVVFLLHNGFSISLI